MESYPLIEEALIYIERHQLHQPSLEEIAAHLGISPFHLQRTFKEWVGISPKRFLQFLTINNARALLRESRTVLEAAWGSG
ncbi:MAG TPA: AraC family transcriptional regulator, partial [Caldithrix abyssi]|nr:AraC family transcriptional regulator [Caldithrix abyssi]